LLVLLTFNYFRQVMFIYIVRFLVGLFAARVLQKEYGVDVVILEARDRTGGRTLTQTVSKISQI